MHLNKEQKTIMPDNSSALSQSDHPKRLRNMCYCVPIDANGDKPKREMVSIIEDNTKPQKWLFITSVFYLKGTLHVRVSFLIIPGK